MWKFKKIIVVCKVIDSKVIEAPVKHLIWKSCLLCDGYRENKKEKTRRKESIVSKCGQKKTKVSMCGLWRGLNQIWNHIWNMFRGSSTKRDIDRETETERDRDRETEREKEVGRRKDWETSWSYRCHWFQISWSDNPTWLSHRRRADMRPAHCAYSIR